MLKLTSLCPVSDRPHLNLTPRSALCLSHSLCHLPELWQALNLLLHLNSWQISPSTTETRLDSTSFSSSVSAQRLNGHPALSYQTIYMHSFRQKGNPSSRLLSVPWRSPPPHSPLPQWMFQDRLCVKEISAAKFTHWWHVFLCQSEDFTCFILPCIRGLFPFC